MAMSKLHLAWPAARRLFRVSDYAKNTTNSIRQLIEVLAVPPNPKLAPQKLHIGDPTVSKSFLPPQTAIDSIQQAVRSCDFNGYAPSFGADATRDAIAEKASARYSVDMDDVVVTSGCCHALQMAFEVLANPGQNILVPSPGFPVGGALMTPHGIEPRAYNLQPDNGWEADLKQMESLIDRSTAAILVNNPGNPTGAVFSKQHLENILAIAEDYQLPVIADEIYGDMVFNGAHFHPVASLNPNVPVITCDGIGKLYMVPGWRLGWMTITDPHKEFPQLKTGIRNLSQKINGPSGLIQAAVPDMLRNTPESYFKRHNDIISNNVDTVCSRLKSLPAFRPIRPHGAMYIMLQVNFAHLPDVADEVDLVRKLIQEQSIYCLPSYVFDGTNGIRLVLSHSTDFIHDTCDRLIDFADRRMGLQHAVAC